MERTSHRASLRLSEVNPGPTEALDVCSARRRVLEPNPTSSKEMVDEPTLILYDAKTKKGTSSPYVFRVRMGLNYKGLPFKTHWTTLSGIREVYEKAGIPPTPHPIQNPFYTVPALLDTSVTPPLAISQSHNIEKHLDEKFPDNPLWSVAPPNADAEDAKKRLVFLEEISLYLAGKKDPRFRTLFTLVIPEVPNILQEVDVPYFLETRARWFNKPFDEIAPKNKHEALNEVKEVFNKIAELVDEYRGKPFDPKNPLDRPWVLGDVVSWADFALAGVFKWVGVSSPGLWDEIKGWNNGRWVRFVEETAQWR